MIILHSINSEKICDILDLKRYYTECKENKRESKNKLNKYCFFGKKIAITLIILLCQISY